MKLHFLGGASEVGASCTLLEAADKKILVDAGIRMGRSDSPLPDLERLRQLGPPDLIFVTHAHADHIGALPLIHLAYPTVPVLTTAPSKDLMTVLLADALKIMDIQWEKEEDIPLYPPHAVEGLLSRIQILTPNETHPLLDGSFTARFTPCGHVLGACAVALDTPEGLIYFAGDYSLDQQRTVNGFTPPKLQPHVVITESTYGNRLHANRAREEERLIQTVQEIVSAGGKVLVPAFALGRAQEVILILLEAKQRGLLADVPLYVDGLVRKICTVYSSHPDFVTQKLAKAVATEGNPFFGEGKATAVSAPKREEIASGPPCVIVSSSGMLTGGPSAFYATHLVKDPKSAILITGYQDEESPGRALLKLAEQVEKKGSGTLRVGGQVLDVECRVQRYGLSAHADGGQMTNIVSKLNPRHAVLVHGDERARPALAQMMPPSLAVHLPQNGETLTWRPFRKMARQKASSPTPPKALGDGAPFDPHLLHEHLLKQNLVGSRYTLEEISKLWYGTAAEEQVDHIEKTIRAARFQADPRRPELFRVLPPLTEKSQVCKVNQALDYARALLEGDPNFSRVGNKQAQRRLILHFHFPEIARGAHQDTAKQIASATGWTVYFSDKANLQKLTELAKSLLPQDLQVSKISLFPDQPALRVKHQPNPSFTADVQQRLQEQFHDLTGRQLEFQTIGQPTSVPEPSRIEGEPMEQNMAFKIVKDAFAAESVTLYRCSRKENPRGIYMELAFITPQIGELYQHLISRLEQETGWAIQYRRQPNPIAIQETVRSLIPDSWRVTKQPSLFHEDQRVTLKVPRRPDQAVIRKLAHQVQKATGYQLEVLS